MVDVVFVKDTLRRRIGDLVSFDEVSAAKIVARGDAEYTGGSTERSPTQSFPSFEGGWGVKDDSAGE